MSTPKHTATVRRPKSNAGDRADAMTRLKSPAALHETIREEIARRVGRGTYTSDGPLPSTATLSAEFGVSAITIKRALRDLQMAGLLRSTPGLGTFVREHRRFVRDLDLSFTSVEDLERMGKKAAMRLVSVGRRRITDPAFSAFGPPPGPMLNIQKVISVDDVAITFDNAFITASLDHHLIEEFGRKFIYEVLNAHGMEVISTRVVIDAAPASREVQQEFGVPNGYPTLRRLYHFKTTEPAISVYGLAEAPFDRLACTIERNRDPAAARGGRPRRSGRPDR
jgi:DNA-binding GntR family transcriptional regulator